MEKIIKEGKEVDVILDEILNESNLTKDEIIYTVNDKKGKLFQGNLKEVTVYKKETINNEIKNYLKEIIENMGLEVSFEMNTKDERTTIKMYSNNNPILIGKNGQTLKALETLAKQKIQNETGIHYKITLDVSNYKDKIKRNLERLAINTAKEVVKTKIPVALDNMTSYERMIIHNKLTDFKGIKTESEGEEPNRHIVIKPE
ncbi:MAG TPA: KH domain-containing protein [Candidatus Onthocola stercorigallinarum]|nr:KH domain-containing protein [Candidatus Onthocola stercorigallinarum]